MQQPQQLSFCSSLAGTRVVGITPRCRPDRQRLGLLNFRESSDGSFDPFMVFSNKRLSTSLFHRVANLPKEGRTLTDADEAAAAEGRTAIHVWESRCDVCKGSGTARTTGSRGRRTLSVCLKCEGVGYVRVISSTQPDEDALDYTLGRPSGNGATGPYCHVPDLKRKFPAKGSSNGSDNGNGASKE